MRSPSSAAGRRKASAVNGRENWGIPKEVADFEVDRRGRTERVIVTLGGRTVAFVGWFGPRGLASIVFALLSIVGSTFLGSVRDDVEVGGRPAVERGGRDVGGGHGDGGRGEEDDGRRLGGVGDLEVLAAQGVDQLLVDDLDDLLGRAEAGVQLGADALLLDPGDEVLDDLEVDVGLEQGDTDLAQDLVDLGFTESARNFQTNNYSRGGSGNDARTLARGTAVADAEVVVRAAPAERSGRWRG